MCEYNENEINEEVENENITLEDLTKEELIEVIQNLTNNKVELNTDSVQDIELNVDEFKVGVDSVSMICGMYSALRSVGYSEDLAHEVILNERNIDHSINTNIMTCENNKDIAKIQELKAEQQQI